MTVTDVRLISGALGPVRAARIVDVSSEAFVDERGFVFQAQTAADYQFLPVDSTSRLTVTMAVGDFPSVAKVPILCRFVYAVAGGSILVANL